MDKLEYEKGGSAGSKGSQFQVHLLVVFLLNSLRMKLANWRLSTEDKRAGKFDDVVLEWSDGAVLLQAKHKENRKRITVEQLMSTTTNNEDFNIPKYFLSHQEIKDKFPLLKKVVICTNASVNERALTFLNPQTDSPDSILFCERDESLFYTLKDGILSELKDKIKAYYSQKFNGREVDESVISDANLKDFQKRFQIYFEYPSGNGVENVIEQLLDKTNWRAKASATEIYSKVMGWFQQKDGKLFTEIHAKAMVSEIKTEKYWQSLKQYNVYFSSNDLNFEDSNRRYHLITEGTALLQEIRIWQGLRGKGRKALYIHTDDSLEDQKQLIKAFELKNYTVLIIVQPNDSVVMEFWDQIEEILNKSAYKKVIFLASRDNKLVRLTESSINSFDVTKESPTFKDLSKETRDMLLKARSILFQGKAISLEDIFAPQDYSTFLESEILKKLVVGEPINVGREVRVLEEEMERFYIRRNFIRNNEERDEGNIFDAKDKLILIADSAGTGKTTTLTKLAALIKENNPHLWILKIVLDDYSKFLKDSLRKHKTTIDIMEFLDSQGTTKWTDQFEKLVFSVNNKVVLMLDGVDEISPDYTELIEYLLVSCLKAPNFIKIFATTRPHLAKKLEEKFQAKSFILEPFSERNQIDFLRSYWIHNLGHTDNEKCEQYARELVRKMSYWTKSYCHVDNDFTAIPLQLNMLAEIFQENGRSEGVVDWEGCQEFLDSDRTVPKLPKKIDLTRLYKLFIQKKRYVFIDKLNPSGSVGAEKALLDQFNDSMAFHRTLSLDVVVGDASDSFSCYKEGGRDCTINALKIGIIQEVDNKLQFVHRTFAEYFVAECLIMELLRHNQKADFQKFFIDKVLMSEQFEVVCIFFNDMLRESEDKVPADIFLNCEHLSYDVDRFKSNYARLVHFLAEKGCVGILRLLLKCVDFKVIECEETRMEELLQQIPNNDNVGNTSILNIFQFFVERGGMNIKDAVNKTPLDLAAGRGHLEMVKFLAEQGANINTRPWKHSTSLYKAATGGHLAVVKYLVEQGADIIASIRRRDTELYDTLCGNHVYVVGYLLDKIVEGGSLERGLDIEYAMIPFSAAYLGRIDILKFLVERGMDVNRSIRNQQSLIVGAAVGRQLEVVEYLVSQGADINSTDIGGNTVLHLLSEKPSLTHIAKFLVDSGIYIDVKNRYGETALHVAACKGAYDMAEFYIKNGADVNSISKCMRYSVLYTAALNNHLTIVELLAEHGADVNVTNIYGNTVLHSVTVSGQLDVVKCLVKLGADVTVQDKTGRTVLHVALLEHQVDIAKYLIGCNSIDVNSRDNDGQTVLHLCVSMKGFSGRMDDHMPFHNFAFQRLGIVKRLVARGANFNITNNEGQTILHLAVLRVALYCIIPSCDQCSLVIKFLIEQGADMGTDSSEDDVMVTLAKEIQKNVRYHGQSLKTILLLPVFRLLDSVLPLNCVSGPVSI